MQPPLLDMTSPSPKNTFASISSMFMTRVRTAIPRDGISNTTDRNGKAR